MDKFSSMENESINPVKPNDNINIMLILSIELHQFLKYFMLNLYNFGDHRTRQIKQTYQLGLKRLSSMEQQKKELGMAIKDLKSQLELCKDLLLKRGADSRDL